MDKKTSRIRRTKKTRAKIKELRAVRLNIHRTPRHIYSQLLDADGKVLAHASTLDAEVKKTVDYSGNIKAAAAVGSMIAERAKQMNITKVAFDRSGFKYHGRIKALADAARKGGLEF